MYDLGAASTAPPTPADLDTLLDSLRPRLEDGRSTRGRLQALLRAVVVIGSELDLPTVLRRLAEAAAELADARYAALAVLDPNGAVTQFHAVGFDEQTRARIGRLPRGDGILGLLVREPRPLRLDDLGTHSASVGFPPGHPPMTSFLGVPIRLRSQVFGNLYLTEKRGAVAFDEQDEAVVMALASAAGVAIENARLYDAARRREGWLQAAADVSTQLLSGTDPEEVLVLIASRARELTGADTSLLALPAGTGRLLVEVADGDDADGLLGASLRADAVPSAGAAGGDPVMLDAQQAGALLPGCGVQSALVAPVGSGGAGGGVLAVLTRGDSLPLASWTGPELRAFAGQVSVALELAARRRDAERLVVYADRDRIARDLHDLVIQRLFATGMQLESIGRLVSPPEAALRMRRAVDDLDTTIREIRSTIYALHSCEQESPSLRTQVLEVVDAGTEQLGFAPDLRLSGLREDAVPATVGDHLLAVLREGLSNVARHARARTVEVRLAVTDRMTLSLRDDGVGLPPDCSRRSGLSHLEARARDLGGTFTVRSPEPGGTELVWTVPLPPAASQRRAPQVEQLG